MNFSVISLTSLVKGARFINKSVDFWKRLTSLKATVPGLYLLLIDKLSYYDLKCPVQKFY